MTRLILTSIGLFLAGLSVQAGNFHIVDRADNGYQLWRSGAPSHFDVREYCLLGISKVIVLSGDAAKFEEKYKSECPTMTVIYNTKQNERHPLTAEFLRWFDDTIEDARNSGEKILFRCVCGCHRTGRLAAYYKMKYKGYTTDDAIKEMEDHGKFMLLFPELDNQVRALREYIDGKTCTEKPKYCVVENDDHASAIE